MHKPTVNKGKPDGIYKVIIDGGSYGELRGGLWGTWNTFEYVLRNFPPRWKNCGGDGYVAGKLIVPREML